MFLKLVYKDQTKKINFTDDLKNLEKLHNLIRNIKAWNVKDFTLSFEDQENETVELHDNHDMDYFLVLTAHEKFATIHVKDAEHTDEKLVAPERDFINVSRVGSNSFEMQPTDENFIAMDGELKENITVEHEYDNKSKLEQLIGDINNLISHKDIQTENKELTDQGITAQPIIENKSISAVVESRDQITGDTAFGDNLYYILHDAVEPPKFEEVHEKPKKIKRCHGKKIKDHSPITIEEKLDKRTEKLNKKLRRMKDKIKLQEDKLTMTINKKVSLLESKIKDLSVNQSRSMTNSEIKEHQAPPTVACMTVHTGVTCDGCRVYPIIGKRFKCMTCPDYDLCETCEQRCIHNHPMVRMVSAANSNLYSQVSKWFSNFNDRFNPVNFVKNMKDREEHFGCPRFRRFKNSRQSNNVHKQTEAKEETNDFVIREEPIITENVFTEPAERRKEKSELIDFIFGCSKDAEAKEELLNRYANCNIEDFYMVIQSNIDTL